MSLAEHAEALEERGIRDYRCIDDDDEYDLSVRASRDVTVIARLHPTNCYRSLDLRWLYMLLHHSEEDNRSVTRMIPLLQEYICNACYSVHPLSSGWKCAVYTINWVTLAT